MEKESNIIPTYGMNSNLVDNSSDDETLLLEECPCCEKQQVIADATDRYICVDCAQRARQRAMSLRNDTREWIEVAMACGLNLYDRQPQETAWEWSVWQSWRSMYPSQKPTYAAVARKLNTSSAAVKRIASRWNYAVRMEAWMDYCDSLTFEEQRQAIVDMNKAHIDMAKTLRDKLKKAIDNLEPEYLVKPSDIVSLAKLSTELERKARLDTGEQEERAISRRTNFSAASGSAQELKKVTADKNDLQEVVSILLKSGALDGIINGASVKATTTTEVTVSNRDAGVIDVQGEVIDE